MTIISERLQYLRLTHGYTQTDLARTMGVSRRAVYAWEHDKCPEIPHLIQLAQFYQVSTDYLLGLTELEVCPATGGLTGDFLPATVRSFINLRNNGQKVLYF